MIAGLPVESWLLMIVAVGAGLIIELAFLRAHRHDAVARRTDDALDASDAERVR